MEKAFAVLGALSAFISVTAGAFAAHALRQRLPPDLLAVFETGARYQMYHALALLLLSVLYGALPGLKLYPVAWFFVIGTLLFSGSLYLLALTGQRALGAITPIGGFCFLAGWAYLAWTILRHP